MKKDELKKLTEKLGLKNSKILLAVLAAAGILLILIGSIVPKDTAEKYQSEPSDGNERYNAMFVSTLQNDITAFITKIDGVGKASVLVTLESGVAYEYATDGRYTTDDGKSSREESIIVVKNGSSSEPLLLRRTEPVVMGVVIVCEGGSNPAVKEKVVETVSVLCGIGSNRISVADMTKNNY